MTVFERWPNFQPRELLSPYGLDLFKRRKKVCLNIQAVDHLQKFRNYIDYPFLINYQYLELRGFRSPEEQLILFNRKQSARFSFHTMGMCFDTTCKKLDTIELANEAQKFGGFTEIIVYNSFVHLGVIETGGTVWRQDKRN